MEIALWTLVFVALVTTGALSWSATERKKAQLERRLGLLERKLDAVLDHLGVPFAEPGFEQVESYVREGKKIQAIKAYRERTGASLVEAKEAVERIAGER